RCRSPCAVILYCYFFFSSRRRHTRWPRDWSSDVCSSDLPNLAEERRNGWKSSRAVLDAARGIADQWADDTDRRVGERLDQGDERSEERRVGKECRSRWWAYH